MTTPQSLGRWVIVIYYQKQGDARPTQVLKLEDDPRGAAIIIEEIWVRGFDDGSITVYPHEVLHATVTMQRLVIIT